MFTGGIYQIVDFKRWLAYNFVGEGDGMVCRFPHQNEGLVKNGIKNPRKAKDFWVVATQRFFIFPPTWGRLPF